MCVEIRMIASGLNEQDAFDLERERIAFWRADGADLANLTDGGEGMSGYKQTPEAIAKVAAAHRGMKRSPETCAKLSEKARARGPNPKSVAALVAFSAAMKGKTRPPFSDEWKANMGRSRKGHKMPDHVKEILRLSHVGKPRPQTAETRAKMSAARLGKPGHLHSEETKAKISAAHKGKKFSDEHRRNISIARKRLFEKSSDVG